MAKVINLFEYESKKKCTDYLDKLEVTSHYFKNKTHESLYNKGITKHIQNTKLHRLIDLKKSDAAYWTKQYEKTIFCNHVLLQQGSKISGSLCRKRWCKTCNRIKTAELINGYLQPLTDLALDNELYFVTLTAPTVKERQLKSEISKRLKAFQKVKNNLRQNYSIKLNGYRKLEITYNKEQNWYHPHFHLIVQGKHEAQMLHNLWLKQFKNAKTVGQDITKITVDADNINALKELFKYATKGSVKDTEDAAAEHTIHKALQGVRIYQPFGKLRKVKTPTEAASETHDNIHVKHENEIYIFAQKLKDWTNANNQKLVNTLEIEKCLNLHHEHNKKKSRAT